MRVDIIVPNFDNSSDEVTLSSWYKKVGDKISKNEIIADAETPQVACGITSSYDCILAQICVKEGEEISQGTKIAVIETDVNADINEIKKAEADETAVEELQEIASEIDSDVAEKHAKEKAEKISEAAARETSSNKNLSVEGPKETVRKEESRAETVTSSEETSYSRGYSLSVPESESKYSLNAAEAERVEEELESAAMFEEEEIEDEIADDLYEKSEKRVSDIMKEAEEKAKEEAKALRENILEEAKKQAVAQAEEVKKRILTEYEMKKKPQKMQARCIKKSFRAPLLKLRIQRQNL